jgi:hypothetical protein
MSINVVQTDYSVEAFLLVEGKEVGHFAVSKGTTLSMSIGIDEPFQKKGHARRLMKAVFEAMPLPPGKRLFIDEDASQGFWAHIGMTANPMYLFEENQREVEGAGYAKLIPYSALLTFVHNAHEPQEVGQVPLHT